MRARCRQSEGGRVMGRYLDVCFWELSRVKEMYSIVVAKRRRVITSFTHGSHKSLTKASDVRTVDVYEEGVWLSVCAADMTHRL